MYLYSESLDSLVDSGSLQRLKLVFSCRCLAEAPAGKFTHHTMWISTEVNVGPI